MKPKNFCVIGLILLFTLMSFQFAIAIDFNDDISDDDKDAFDEILEPVMKVYNLVKYSATVVAVLVLLFAGVSYMTSGANPGKREKAKNMVSYVVVGLIVIWAAPLVVNFIVG